MSVDRRARNCLRVEREGFSTMLPALRARSHLDMQYEAAPPIEYNDDDYFREVLQLDGLIPTEMQFDERLNKEAENLGISITGPSADERIDSPPCESPFNQSHHTHTDSSLSQESDSTGLTSRSSNEHLDISSLPQPWKRPTARRSLSFHDYEKFVKQIDAQNKHPLPPPIPVSSPESAPSLFSVSSKRSYISIKNGIKTRFRRKPKTSGEQVISCICCREEFKNSSTLRTLPCAHNYCEKCLRVLAIQGCKEESKMPPRCCSQAIPGNTIKSVLDKEEQSLFMKSVVQFSTPWEARIFCPNTSCGEFIPTLGKIDPKQPFEVVCRTCGDKACSICKRAAHPGGQDCPEDYELEAVLRMAKNAGWRRCYKCRTLVELSQGCSHITCRCKAQFCYICGAVWDPSVGCPNYCNGEEMLERRRLEEEQRIAEEEKAKLAREEAEKLEAEERAAAEERTRKNATLNALRACQINERDRFCAFERKMKWIMWTRHGRAKIDILDRYGELSTKMKERHQRTSTHLEDRQVAAEMELRATLKQSERSVQIRLKHMEAYCNGLGRSSGGYDVQRIVTEKDLRELGQQYNIRDDLGRLHQSRINVMRDKQAKQMENLIIRQDEELKNLMVKQNQELEALEEMHSREEEGIMTLFIERKSRLTRRWYLVEEVERKKLTNAEGVQFAAMPPIPWPQSMKSPALGLEAVFE
ncbi:hypothetical protein BELL_1184g00010 [Botrytis elliptica]|uniref:RBR-type E3 ubiquitin transferase n=1 Tax=Botrytis elliptica TaxID=278938 RepID=A0A4Z1IWG2_9HELO|nr:hypothetical protein EAE99_009222 [Botrytis elliptica]TGO60897.1 hypothetical protein BELL_1184g00010 [Botrytis elliptica]